MSLRVRASLADCKGWPNNPHPFPSPCMVFDDAFEDRSQGEGRYEKGDGGRFAVPIPLWKSIPLSALIHPKLEAHLKAERG